MSGFRATSTLVVIAASLLLPVKLAVAAEEPQARPTATRVEAKTPAHESSIAENFMAIGAIWLAAATTFLWIATYRLHTGTERASATTANQMKEQIEAAIASNKALNAVAEATRNNAVLMSELMVKQFRAYISVDFGQAFYQEEGASFAAEAIVTNRALTPAHNVSFWIKARVMKHEAVDLSMPAGTSLQQNDATVTPHQSFVIFSAVDHRFSQEQVEEIMAGQKQRLFVFGEVHYDDIYGKAHVTSFCHTFYFTKAPQGGYRYHGQLHPRHNTAT